MAEINAALQVGKEVITHTDAISVPGWSGAGYIIFDPVTGGGAYKISGGGNGGEIDLGNIGLALGIMAGGLDGFAEKLVNEGLPYDEDLPLIKIAKVISKVAAALGAAAVFLDIYNALEGLENGSVSPYKILGKLSVVLFGFAVGKVSVTGVAAVFFPVTAGIVSAIVIASLGLLLAEFTAIYFSYYLFNRIMLAEIKNRISVKPS